MGRPHLSIVKSSTTRFNSKELYFVLGQITTKTGLNFNKAKKILKINRGQLKKLIELITGQNNLNYMNNKVYGSEDLCRFCEEEEETFDHIINECPCFYLDRCDLLQNQPIINTLEWDPETLLKFANIDTIKDALSFNPRTENIW